MWVYERGMTTMTNDNMGEMNYTRAKVDVCLRSPLGSSAITDRSICGFSLVLAAHPTPLKKSLLENPWLVQSWVGAILGWCRKNHVRYKCRVRE
jgi:hypothetical protein